MPRSSIDTAVRKRVKQESGSRIDYTDRSYWNGTIKMSLSKFFILAALNDRAMHGYEIARTVANKTRGCCSPSEGTIYPVLREFEEDGLVQHHQETVQGRVRKIYRLTERGKQAFHTAVEAWMEITSAMLDAGRCILRDKL